jgi:hypothetical protein
MALSVAALFLLALPTSFAQWSSDPSVNLAICDTSGSQELPKIAATSDGGCYVSWFDTRGGGYKVYMQRLNAQGVKQWATNGLLISANPQNTSLVDYDLGVDDSNYAVVVFTDIRNSGQIEPFAYRISPQGNFVWGANGVALSTSSATYQPNPKVVSTSDGSCVFAWIFSSTPNKVALQKLNAAGAKQWGVDPILLVGSGTENLTYPSLVRSDAGSVILLMSGYTGTFLNPQNYRLYTQKYSPSGAPMWGSVPDTVYALGRVSGFFVPKLIPDGNNGAFYVWHDDRNNTGSSFSHVQHITSADVKLFPVNGTSGSTLPGRLHNDAWVSYTPATGETYMFWYETDAQFQSSYGVYGQKFSSNGTRQWPDSGKAFRPFGGGQPSFIRCAAKDSAAVVFYFDGVTVTNNLVKGFKVDRNGNLLWGGSIINVSSVLSSKGRLGGALTTDGTSLLAWSDNRVDGNGVYGQDVNFDGTLGNPLPPVGWTQQTSGITNQFYSVKAVNATTAWAAAVGGRVLRTINGGNTWTSVGGGRIGTADVYNITAVDGNTAFVTTTPSTTTYIFRTTNGGSVWDTVFQQAGGFIDAMHLYDATNGIAIGDPVAGRYTFLRTTNGGTTWVRTATEPIPGTGEASSQNDLAVFGTNYIWIGASANGRIYRSTDAGATWASSTVPGAVSATNVIAVWFNSAQYGIASAVNGSTYTAYRSTDGGVTWTTATVGTAGYNIAVGGSGTDDFLMARGTDVYRSTNRGTTWSSSYTGTGTFYDLDFCTSGSSTYGWGVKDNGNIVMYYGTITGVREEVVEIPQTFALMQNYPNPFNPTTTLRYALPKDARVNLSIYNILGQRITTLKDAVQSGGYYDVVWDGRNDLGSQVSSGVYFYRVEARPVDGRDVFTSIEKMLLLK